VLPRLAPRGPESFWGQREGDQGWHVDGLQEEREERAANERYVVRRPDHASLVRGNAYP
jgi:hypothetical protein